MEEDKKAKEVKEVKESKFVETIIDFLIGLPLFDDLTAGELKTVAKHMNFIEVQKDDIVFTEGDKGNYMCFVVDGMLDVIKQTESHKQVLISSLARGRSIGEMSVIDNFPRSATVRARTPSTLLVLTRDAFDQILISYPQLGIKLLKSLTRLVSMNLRKASSQLADLLTPLT
ncbi:MAG: cyclic nucleotide-binding domain-containing protein [Pseudomonadota bacterium]